MDVECSSSCEVKASSEPPTLGPEGENAAPPPQEDTTPGKDESTSKPTKGKAKEGSEKSKWSKIPSFKNFVAGKMKSKEEKKKTEGVPLSADSVKEELKARPQSQRELRRSFSRVFSSIRLGRVWRSFSSTRLSQQDESSSVSTLTLGRMFKKQAEEELAPEARSQTLSRFTFRSAFSKQS